MADVVYARVIGGRVEHGFEPRVFLRPSGVRIMWQTACPTDFRFAERPIDRGRRPKCRACVHEIGGAS